MVLKEVSKGFEGLKEEIIDKKRCSYCGACLSFCEHLEPGPDAPVLKEDCSLDKDGVLKCSTNGTCYDICPMTETDIEGLEMLFLDSECVNDEFLGVYKTLIAGKTVIEGQDGGMVTSMLVAGMEKELFDCAIVAERIDGYNAVPEIAEDVEMVVSAKGTKYVSCPMVSKIGEAVKRGKRKIGIVGTPCEIRAVRKIQSVLLREVPQIDITAIGLFCFESFYPDKFASKLKELFGIDLSSASKIQIAKGECVVTVNDERHKTKIANLEDTERESCHYCDDLTARLADISVGSLGSAEGYCTVIVRSEKGAQLLDLIEFSRGKVDKEEISRIVRLKKAKVKDRR
jgi:coenzyme F420-reducing hydrogenase beta subunit